MVRRSWLPKALQCLVVRPFIGEHDPPNLIVPDSGNDHLCVCAASGTRKACLPLDR